MDIQKEREAFQKFCEENFDFERHEQTYFDEQTQCYENDIGEDTESINMAWSAWQAAKSQAVPEWKDYTVESPRIDGPYQIFIMNQQLVAKWESPWGFSSIEDGDALNQELITHWSVLGNDPAIKPQEPSQ